VGYLSYGEATQPEQLRQQGEYRRVGDQPIDLSPEALAKAVNAVFKECGTLSVVECWGDDVPDGKLTSFPMAVKCAADETVVFSWIMWPSRQVRDVGMKKVMADPRLQSDTNPITFDGKRLIYGGFEILVRALPPAFVHAITVASN